MSDDPRQGWTSASAAESDALCQGRFLAQKGIPELSSDAAEFGTQVHKAFETGDDSDLNVSQEWIAERARELEKEAVEIVFGAAELFKVYDYAATQNVAPYCARELRLWYSYSFVFNDGGLKHSGMADVFYVGGKSGLILDLKSLRGQVALSPTNMQLRDLAVLLWWADTSLDAIYVGIIQPMVKGKPVLTRYDRKDLAHALGHMQVRIEKSNNPDSPRTPGPIQCKYCRAMAAGTCAEGRAWLDAQLPVVTTGDNKDSLKSKALALPLDKAVELWRKSSAIKTILDANAERLKSASDEALAAVRLKKKPGVSREKVTKPNELYARLAPLGVTVQEYTAIVGVPKGKFQELVRAKTALKGKALDKLCDELLAGLTETTVGAEQLEEIG